FLHSIESLNGQKSIQGFGDFLTNHFRNIILPCPVELFLSHVTMQLDYYRSLMDLLYKLHVDLGLGRLTMTPTCLFILRLCLGWLFDRPNIPVDDYYDYRRKLEVSWVKKPQNRRKNGRREIERNLLKSLNPILEAILNVACPFLGDFRLSVMPAKATKVVSRTGRYRHITTKSPAKKTAAQDAQKQLTDAFLQSQSPSMRKIVDFVTERVTSAAIKNFQVLYFLDIKKATQREIAQIQADDQMVILERLQRIYQEVPTSTDIPPAKEL
uniref:Codanin-1 C-terminal domain-containing protein n=1 Tax=Phlebotomus papatasi TaxID=29031 RepID=A0A1B0DLB3_PHLPP